MVQFLGNEEVVAVVRDDGDVDAFLVRHIVHAIARRAEPFTELGLHGDEIRPFFQSNVGKSAWGVAIHAQARILATSANTHEVRVFKFGLLQTDDDRETSEDDVESLPDVDNNYIKEQQERKTDVTYEILNGEANIPYIAFCNTGDDPEGRWLLTTDIMGVCQVMDLFEMKPVQKFRFGRSFATPNLGQEDRFDRLNAGWVLMFLDRRSFQEEDSVDSALGLYDDESLPSIKRNPAIWDISKTVQHVPEYSEPFVYHRPKRRRNGHRSSGNAASRTDETADARTVESREEHHEDDIGSDASSDGGAQLEVEIEVPEQAPEHGAHGASGDSAAQEDDPDETMSNGDNSDSDLEPTALIDDAQDPDDEMAEDTIASTSWYNGESITANEPQFAIKDINFWDKLPCPILHASVRNIYLMQPFINQHQSTGPWSPPMVRLANPLRQSIQQDFEYLRIFERVNMTVTIPPLGVVVLASQKGRALVLSLTKVPASAHYPPDLVSLRQQPDASERVAWINKTNYTMRVECILPFAQQEKANQRPFAPLHGIAAAPLQGCEGEGKSGPRWRVMMMYQDHSVLSYEIGRKVSAGEDGMGMGKGVDVEELVV